MSNMREMKQRMEGLGFSTEELLKIWFEVYVLSTEKEDLHAKFACRLNCTRGDAKVFHWMLLYKSPYLKHILRQEGVSRLSWAKAKITAMPDKVNAENFLEKHVDYLERINQSYIEKYRTIDPNYVN